MPKWDRIPKKNPRIIRKIQFVFFQWTFRQRNTTIHRLPWLIVHITKHPLSWPAFMKLSMIWLKMEWKDQRSIWFFFVTVSKQKDGMTASLLLQRFDCFEMDLPWQRKWKEDTWRDRYYCKVSDQIYPFLWSEPPNIQCWKPSFTQSTGSSTIN